MSKGARNRGNQKQQFAQRMAEMTGSDNPETQLAAIEQMAFEIVSTEKFFGFFFKPLTKEFRIVGSQNISFDEVIDILQIIRDGLRAEKFKAGLKKEQDIAHATNQTPAQSATGPDGGASGNADSLDGADRSPIGGERPAGPVGDGDGASGGNGATPEGTGDDSQGDSEHGGVGAGVEDFNGDPLEAG